VKIGTEIEVKILRVDPQERKIGLSKKRAEWAAADDGTRDASKPKARRGGLHGPGAESTDVIQYSPIRPTEESSEVAEGGETTEEQPPASE